MKTALFLLSLRFNWQTDSPLLSAWSWFSHGGYGVRFRVPATHPLVPHSWKQEPPPMSATPATFLQSHVSQDSPETSRTLRTFGQISSTCCRIVWVPHLIPSDYSECTLMSSGSASFLDYVFVEFRKSTKYSLHCLSSPSVKVSSFLSPPQINWYPLARWFERISSGQRKSCTVVSLNINPEFWPASAEPTPSEKDHNGNSATFCQSPYQFFNIQKQDVKRLLRLSE